ncbi:hypothetical protein [Rhizobium sp. NPDC092017]|uniref:hypothetical protein n=1 Tax=Rhizobium sp. NPDC092017 TaxID=3364502 RepID=UPI00381A7156
MSAYALGRELANAFASMVARGSCQKLRSNHTKSAERVKLLRNSMPADPHPASLAVKIGSQYAALDQALIAFSKFGKRR